MPKCLVKDCQKLTQFKNTKNKYCLMHLARIRRHGYPELKKERGEHSSEKLPHSLDNFILKNSNIMDDEGIVTKLEKMGYKNISRWNIGYRRRKLGKRKYLRGEIKKHKAWIRTQAIRKYGDKCEICGYCMAVDTHHIIPKYQGGPHEIENLIVICPNCHALITRGKMILKSRDNITKIRKEMMSVIKSYYKFQE
ncbi:MAG: HNH endonuclease signature motif containing protein [Patescibacteria group bacterium]